VQSEGSSSNKQNSSKYRRFKGFKLSKKGKLKSKFKSKGKKLFKKQIKGKQIKKKDDVDYTHKIQKTKEKTTNYMKESDILTTYHEDVGAISNKPF
jgi:hypothetical protein